MNLILCDDDKVFLNKLEIRIRGLCQKHKIAVKMECYVSAKEMLEGIKNLDEISVFFIDIDMPEVNGFEVASYLKKWNRECCIVFVSNKDDLVFQSLVYHPFFFIRKAHLDEELEPQLLELQKKAGKKVPQIELQTGRQSVKLALRDIWFVESEKKSDEDGYMSWDVEHWSAIDKKRFIRCYSLEGRVLSESTGHNIYDLYNEFKPEDALKVELS